MKTAANDRGSADKTLEQSTSGVLNDPPPSLPLFTEGSPKFVFKGKIEQTPRKLKMAEFMSIMHSPRKLDQNSSLSSKPAQSKVSLFDRSRQSIDLPRLEKIELRSLSSMQRFVKNQEVFRGTVKRTDHSIQKLAKLEEFL